MILVVTQASWGPIGFSILDRYLKSGYMMPMLSGGGVKKKIVTEDFFSYASGFYTDAPSACHPDPII